MVETYKKMRIRAGHRDAEELLAADHPDITTLSQLRLSLKEKLEVLSKLDSEILCLIDDEVGITDEIEQSDGIKEGINTILVKTDDLAKLKSPPSPPVSSTSPPDGVRVVGGGSCSTVKLPKLTIQPFKRDITTWIMFWNSNKATIHENGSLSDIDKFNYLCSLLQGPAFDVVSGLTLTAANYKEAVSVLEGQYENKQQIVSRHMDILLNELYEA